MTAVVGLDLSLTGTGIATPGGLRTVTSRGKADASLRDRAIRLHDLAMTIVGHVETAARRDVDGGALVVIEAPAFDSRTGHQHDRSGLWWLIVDELIGPSWALVAEVTTGGVKKYATGAGNAKKAAVVSAVAHRYGLQVADDNQADAFVLRAMGSDWLGQPLASVPKTHRDALDKVAWPARAGAS